MLLAAGGRLDVTVPSQHYASTFADDHDRAAFECLLQLATNVTTLPFAQPTEESFLSAGKHAVDGADLLLAIWDGHGAAGLGGTADIVRYAHEEGVTVKVVWPPGSKRT